MTAPIRIPSPPIPSPRAEALVEFVRASALSACTTLRVTDDGWQVQHPPHPLSTGETVLWDALAAFADGDDHRGLRVIAERVHRLDACNERAATVLLRSLGLAYGGAA